MDKPRDTLPIVSIVTFLLFSIAAIKILLTGEHYNIGLSGYLNFANLLVFTFDTLRNLLYFILPILIYLLLKGWIHEQVHKLVLRLGSARLLGPKWKEITLWILVGLSAFTTIGWYYNLLPGYSMVVKYICEAGIFCAWIISKKWKIADLRLLKSSLLIAFLVIYIKLDFKSTMLTVAETKRSIHGKIVLKYLNIRDSAIFLDSVNYPIFNTTDFLFVHNDSTKLTSVFPVANILSFTTSDSDSAWQIFGKESCCKTPNLNSISPIHRIDTTFPTRKTDSKK